MNEQKAKEIISEYPKISAHHWDGPTPEQAFMYAEAKGYLEAIAKMQMLEKALDSIKNRKEYSCECHGECSCDYAAMTFLAEDALAKWEEEK